MFWLWFALWAVLVVFAIGVFAVLGLTLFRRAVALFKEVGAASERVAELQERLTELQHSQQARREELAVFSDPNQLRARRIQDRKLRDRARARAKSRAARSLSATGERRD